MTELTVPQAAAALGVSVDTIKRRIKRGELTTRLDSRGRHLITLDDAPSTTPAATPLEVAALTADLDEARRQLAEAQAVLAEVRAHRDSLQAQVETLRGELTTAHTAAAELRTLMGLQLQALPAHHTEGTQDTARSGWRWPWQR